MTTPIVKDLIDEQIDDIEQKLTIVRYGMPFNEVIGEPRETLVRDLSQRLAPSQKGRQIAVRVRP